MTDNLTIEKLQECIRVLRENSKPVEYYLFAPAWATDEQLALLGDDVIVVRQKSMPPFTENPIYAACRRYQTPAPASPDRLQNQKE